ncbi:MAG: hypothetical protein HY566_03835 [Candidatus Kerfeldbacteria bacterium]|nr:hypothetical protein [Candidatus Kerfeldbacteria bacterium]
MSNGTVPDVQTPIPDDEIEDKECMNPECGRIIPRKAHRAQLEAEKAGRRIECDYCCWRG